jgi:tRNA 2-selenouridine synthase
MPELLKANEFIACKSPVLDVRAPCEYAKGHIPGSSPLPLFDDAQRAEVGTLYRRRGKDASILLGLELVGPRLRTLVESAKELSEDGRVSIHCARGGMRSSSVAWLLETAGLQAALLEGGYKAFRVWALETLDRGLPLLVVGGLTGSGKTDLLHALCDAGEQIVDLEGLANHRGSAFGGVGQPPQPTQQQFENELALALHRLDSGRRVWIEDESRLVGRCQLPALLWEQMRAAPVVVVERDREERVRRLAEEYGSLDPGELASCTRRIQKRLGSDRATEAVELIAAGDMLPAVALALSYYDKTYGYGLSRRSQESLSPIDVAGLSATAAAASLCSWADQEGL